MQVNILFCPFLTKLAGKNQLRQEFLRLVLFRSMYSYNQIDKKLVSERVEQFADQMRRYLAGRLDEEHFRPLRLQNGLYLQRHAPMLRIAIPYGTLDSTQMRALGDLADKYDKGYGHFTTRQNVQLNWPQLERVPQLLGELAEVGMHAIQTSGNCVRNITSDPLAGCAVDEVIDPRVVCELIRKWATLNPEFAYLPRKFKIAVIASEEDRAAMEVHDLGVRIRAAADPLDFTFDLWAGGGLGRTPYIGKCLFQDLPIAELRNYLQAVLRVYNLEGRRDNKYKARIKILLNALGVDIFRQRVAECWREERENALVVTRQELVELVDMFALHLPQAQEQNSTGAVDNAALERWQSTNLLQHRVPGYCLVHISLKRPGIAAGDLSSDLMRAVAELAECYSHSEIRVTHDQNLVLPYVLEARLPQLYQRLTALGLAHPNRGLVTDAIACPGLDFCSLANAPVIELADELHKQFPDLAEQLDIGPLEIKMSGCMNACGHHHIGNIGILGVDKRGEFFYQITLGGRDSAGAVLGQKLGPAVPLAEVGNALRRVVDCYLAIRQDNELFAATVARTGVEPFKEAAYAMDYS